MCKREHGSLKRAYKHVHIDFSLEVLTRTCVAVGGVNVVMGMLKEPNPHAGPLPELSKFRANSDVGSDQAIQILPYCMVNTDLISILAVLSSPYVTSAPPTGGVYFEVSARENHEGVHAAFLHLCQEVGSYLSLLIQLVYLQPDQQDVHCLESTRLI